VRRTTTPPLTQQNAGASADERETSMKRSVLVLVLASIVSMLAVGCASSGVPAVAFEPRAYPYVPRPDGPR
jgi:hypothetical protein